jgi:DNA-binding Xre family transcriptional regulator
MRDSDTFGVRLIKAMNRAQMSNKTLAAKLDVTESTVSSYKYERKVNCTASRIKDICRALMCSSDFLLGLSDNPEIK